MNCSRCDTMNYDYYQEKDKTLNVDMENNIVLYIY